ncbi:integrase arm-type DNA-binding domain-containing protein [Paraburkholderia sp. Ac-20347]|uniref:tyrosine-type recombinase/integrase n=1 Tax=Paraburkholderia sp. Ac-20347 TaxID=2703892 RepID=UPI00197CCFF3|nr:integrase arm-type DNA-binding domain-containing protein [Paraburkholderia sp. Ac-20347]MBN3811619.1 integrase arm-type DNA-binding domain-containing protein [Paraburkholderia sp. Ac-20347]
MNSTQRANARPLKVTDASLKVLRPSDRPHKLSVGGGLYLLVSTAGSKTWKMAYRFGGRQRTLKIGLFPYVNLAEARLLAYEARKLLAVGIDPVAAREKERLMNVQAHTETLGALCAEWLEHRRGSVADYTFGQSKTWLERYVVCRDIGRLPVAEVTAAHVHQLVRGVANGSIRTGFERQNGSTYVAGKLKQLLGQVFRYAISSGRAQNNPATMIALSDAVKPRRVRHNKALPPSQMCALLCRIDSERRMLTTRTLAATILLSACRTGEALQARWGEFDFENALWNIPASRMKNKQPHCFPLSAQLAARLLALRAISQKTNIEDYVFYSPKAKVLPHLSRGAVNAIFAQMGLNEETNNWFRAHGARGSVAVWAYESGWWRSEVIECYLSHVERNKVKLAYTNATKYISERRDLAQRWADLIDPLTATGNTRLNAA